MENVIRGRVIRTNSLRNLANIIDKYSQGDDEVIGDINELSTDIMEQILDWKGVNTRIAKQILNLVYEIGR